MAVTSKHSLAAARPAARGPAAVLFYSTRYSSRGGVARGDPSQTTTCNHGSMGDMDEHSRVGRAASCAQAQGDQHQGTSCRFVFCQTHREELSATGSG